MKRLTIINIKEVLRTLVLKSIRDADDAWLKGKELEVCNGLRREALNHGR